MDKESTVYGTPIIPQKTPGHKNNWEGNMNFYEEAQEKLRRELPGEPGKVRRWIKSKARKELLKEREIQRKNRYEAQRSGFVSERKKGADVKPEKVNVIDG